MAPLKIIIISLAIGLTAGLFGGILGIGGGLIMIPVMVILIGFTQHMAHGTALLVMVPAGSIGALTHWKMGNVETGILWGLIPGIILGTYTGGNFANIIPDNILRLIFALILIFVGIRYFGTSSE